MENGTSFKENAINRHEKSEGYQDLITTKALSVALIRVVRQKKNESVT